MTVTMTTSTATAVKRSWADIVKGCSASMPPDADLEATFAIDAVKDGGNALTPGKRGERRCHCQGEILVMLGHYGWIMTFDAIDHPDVWKTAGRVYVNKRDLPKGASLSQGDTVSFYLYADDQGIGAEGVQLEQRSSPGLCAEADEFVPMGGSDTACPTSCWNAGAYEFVPASPGFNTQAAEFVPGFNTQAAEFVPGFNTQAAEFVSEKCVPSTKCFSTGGFAINPAFFSDDDSDDESTICDDNDLCGASSESEAEDVMRCSKIQPPPGLTLPVGFRPPPGLTLEAY